jgi:hypothetical protein
MVLSGWAQDSNPALEAFRWFVNGEEPVEEAVVYRRITKPDGQLVNEEWFRFGCQGDSWYAERLVPDPEEPTNLVAHPTTGICGASLKYLWAVGHEDIHLAEKTFASGSRPEGYTSMPVNFMQHAMTLGLPVPHNGIGHIRWDGLSFTVRSESGYKRPGVPAETNTVKGTLTLGPDGLPVSAEYPGVGKSKGAVVSYEYNSTNTVLPTVFTTKFDGAPSPVFRWEFLSLKLGKADLQATGGYVPKMFADLTIPRRITFWTNSAQYSLINNRLVPGFLTSHPKRTGSLIMIALGCAVAAFLALWYWRSKRNNRTTQQKTT